MSDKTFYCARCKEHKPTTPGPTTGYGEDDKGRKFCFACCGVQDREVMVKDGRATLYLTSRGVDCDRFTFYTVTNWPGTLEFDAGFGRHGRHNIAGTRTDVWFNGPDGHVWHGVTYGDNTQLCHCKRTKRKVA